MVQRFMLVVLAVATLFGACRKAPPPPPDPTQALADLRSGDDAQASKAVLAIVEFGDRAVPGLIELLTDWDPRFRVRAASALWLLEAKACPAVPGLNGLLDDPEVEVRRTVAMALSNVGTCAAPAVPKLIKALKDRDPTVRQHAAKALGAIGPAAEAAVPALAEMSRIDALRPAAEEAIRRIRGGR
jgi:HEAT repeat protein